MYGFLCTFLGSPPFPSPSKSNRSQVQQPTWFPQFVSRPSCCLSNSSSHSVLGEQILYAVELIRLCCNALVLFRKQRFYAGAGLDRTVIPTVYMNYVKSFNTNVDLNMAGIDYNAYGQISVIAPCGNRTLLGNTSVCKVSTTIFN